jgi:hypothetical protein
MPKARFEYRGNLADTPLAKMLATIHRYRVPGVLTARRPENVKKVFLEDGRVVFASSSDMADALGAFLMKRGILTADQVNESGRRLADGKKRQGEVLVAMGALTPAQMASAVLAQVTSIVWSLFDWEEGEVTFEVGRFRSDETIQMTLPISVVIRDGLLKHADPKALVKRIGPSWTILEPVPGVEPGIPLEPAEEKYLAKVDGKTTFVDLCRVGPAEAATNAKLLYLLFCLDLVRRKAENANAKKIQWRTAGGAIGERR